MYGVFISLVLLQFFQSCYVKALHRIFCGIFRTSIGILEKYGASRNFRFGEFAVERIGGLGLILVFDFRCIIRTSTTPSLSQSCP